MAAAYVTPPKLAERLAVSPEKVIGWIRRGELRAVDVSDKQGGRPQWRIAESDIAVFLERRAAPAPKPKTRARRATPGEVIAFF